MLDVRTEAELLALRLWLGLATAGDIDDWLDQYVNDVTEPHADALELFSLPFEQEVPAFMAFVLSVFEFDPDSHRGSEVATILLAQLCKAALEGRLSVPQLCDTLSCMDAKYTTPGLRAPYPRTLGELRNGCDWCDDTWSLDHPGHMPALLSQHVRARGNGEP